LLRPVLPDRFPASLQPGVKNPAGRHLREAEALPVKEPTPKNNL
jgi:hypothetical protein